MKTTIMEAATMKTTTVEAAAVKTTTMEAATAASVKPTAPTMTSSVSEVRLAQRSGKQQSCCGWSQNPARFGLNSFFA